MDDDRQRVRRRWERLRRAPSWSRGLLLRRVVAAALAAAAVVVALLPDAGAERTGVLVAARDLVPGEPLRAADVVLAAWPPGLVPGGALRRVDDASGRAPAGPVRAGEPLTDLRLIGPEIAERTAGPGASAVPLRPADPAVATLLSPGARVDVISDGPAGPRVLAARAGVVAMLPPPGAGAGGAGSRGGPGPLVLVALPKADATAVAAATLAGEVTVTLR